MTFKEFVCKLLGHLPRGPVENLRVLYRCDRCENLLKFKQDYGWEIFHD